MKNLRFLPLLPLFLVLAQCATSPAPEVTPSMVKKSSVSAERLENGRQVYRTSCVNCHGRATFGHSDAAYWTAVVPHMADKADLLPADQADVLNYLIACQLEADRGKD
ncbi:mono/diheme cytochrome c family protein [Haloferula luteola]|uniref:Mono/diheme cytochrome c family protein n=1 Tax=Haloferula luteola TaxID=595692 RepID=A0A840V9Z8_9BACT|nr:cytochrome c [Haloferula luteola]MBB5352394.1 mono/diheme cytochrome c family protein [Haloferula luteola]